MNVMANSGPSEVATEMPMTNAGCMVRRGRALPVALGGIHGGKNGHLCPPVISHDSHLNEFPTEDCARGTAALRIADDRRG